MNHASKLFEWKSKIGLGPRLKKDGAYMNEMIWLVGIVLLYFALQLYILPKLGIST